MLKGKIYKRKALNPKKVRGVGAFALSYSIYAYLPYITVVAGTTLPVLSAVAAGLYGLLAFAESNIINTIEFINEGEHQGKLLINIGLTSFTSKNIIVDIKDIHSIATMDNDDIGYDENDKDDLVGVAQFVDKATGELVTKGVIFSLSGEAHSDKDYLDWILTLKAKDDYTTDLFSDLLHRNFLELTNTN